ncbi:RNA-binding protein 39 [Dissophora globulifera]|uniref:RNA-binding protein 39 n=1 Tax=Dissophora globulifera TaxID=979702 RepID=A0A9P6US97_9FUNG|nr:RNA-binding protein 39 [Dissophora globulifera]
MDGKLQEKFALVQQMKREKERKEAKAKESQAFDIFALAGVNLPTGSGGPRGDMAGRRPRAERSNSSNQAPLSAGFGQAPSQPTIVTSPRGADENGTGKKLKRSSMAVRNATHAVGQEDGRYDTQLRATSLVSSGGLTRGRQPSIGSVTSSASTPSHSMVESPITATPPTPIPSPRTEVSAKQDGSVNGDLTQQRPMQRVRDMTRNIHSRQGSMDENEEMILDMYGRSIPRSRHQSSDESSEVGSDNSRLGRRRRSEYEDDYRHPYGHTGAYEPRYRSLSRSRSPKRRDYRRSRSRSVSPYFRHGSSTGDDDYYRRSEGDRAYERDRRSDYRDYRQDVPATPSSEADPFLAASRYLDTAFYPTKIYVGNLPESASLTSLRTAFGPFGDIDDLNLVEGKDFGFVTYREPEAARKALEQMNGTKIDGVEIRVNRAKIPERNRHGFAGVAWMDEDGELAKIEEEQHKQAAAAAKTILGPGPNAGSNFDVGSGARAFLSPLASPPYTSGSAVGAGAYGTRGASFSASTSSTASSMTTLSDMASSDKTPRPIHQLPPRPRSPKLPPKPTTLFPPVGADPRAAIAARGGGRQILKYDDL